MTSRWFPALLKYWRGRRGLSQLELALEAEVSARHVSFLESGRAQPSPAMVLRLLSVLGVPLRDQNEALRAAGLPPHFPESSVDALPSEVDLAITRMMEQHEPFPLSVLAREATVLRANRSARAMYTAFAAEPHAVLPTLNIFDLFFDPRLWRPFVVGWEHVAHAMLARLHREALLSADARLLTLIDRLLGFPNVPAAWRQPDFSMEGGPILSFRLARGSLRVGFLVAVTTFPGPGHVTLDELRIESCFPLDEDTRRFCEGLTSSGRVTPPRATGSSDG